MNVLHINQSDLTGGAAIAAHRLHEALTQNNIKSRLLVGQRTQAHADIDVIPDRYQILEKQIVKLTWRLGLNYVHYINSFYLNQHHFYQQADIINFHNLHGRYFNYLALPHLTKHKPAVMTLHDMWSFTGHCAYSYQCDRWQTGCGKCPDLLTYPAAHRDSTPIEWRLKRWAFNQSKITIVAPSRSLYTQAQNSLLRNCPIVHIPHGIDLEQYQPLGKEMCRKLLGLPSEKNILLFSATHLNDPRKGFDLFCRALLLLPDSIKDDLLILSFGDGNADKLGEIGLPTVHLGFLCSDRDKAIAYSAADLFVFPSRADIFGLVALESMACGTPIIAFQVGGVSDLVQPGITGYLAYPEDFVGLSDKITNLLEDKQERDRLSHSCRTVAQQQYSLQKQAQSYMSLYQEILDRQAAHCQ